MTAYETLCALLDQLKCDDLASSERIESLARRTLQRINDEHRQDVMLDSFDASKHAMIRKFIAFDSMRQMIFASSILAISFDRETTTSAYAHFVYNAHLASFESLDAIADDLDRTNELVEHFAIHHAFLATMRDTLDSLAARKTK